MAPIMLGTMAAQTVDWWRYTATSAVSILFACGAFWLAGASEFVRRSDVERLIETHGPYVEDRKSILAELSASADTMREMRTQMRQMSDRLSELTGEIRREHRETK